MTNNKYKTWQVTRVFLEKFGYFFGELDLNEIETLVLNKGNMYTGGSTNVTDPDLIRKIMKNRLINGEFPFLSLNLVDKYFWN